MPVANTWPPVSSWTMGPSPRSSIWTRRPWTRPSRRSPPCSGGRKRPGLSMITSSNTWTRVRKLRLKVSLRSLQQLHSFYDDFNTINSPIKFTIEHIKNLCDLDPDSCPCLAQDSIPFLDTSLSVPVEKIHINLDWKKSFLRKPMLERRGSALMPWRGSRGCLSSVTCFC